MKEKSSNKTKFPLSDLGCSAALLCCGYTILTLERANPSKVIFVFSYGKNIDLFATKYWSNELRVDARTFYETVKMLKTRIYSPVL